MSALLQHLRTSIGLFSLREVLEHSSVQLFGAMHVAFPSLMQLVKQSQLLKLQLPTTSCFPANPRLQSKRSLTQHKHLCYWPSFSMTMELCSWLQRLSTQQTFKGLPQVLYMTTRSRFFLTRRARVIEHLQTEESGCARARVKGKVPTNVPTTVSSSST